MLWLVAGILLALTGCASNCPGWREVDDSPATVPVATKGWCWKVTSGPNTSLMSDDAEACPDADAHCLLLHPGETFHVFTLVAHDGKADGRWTTCGDVCQVSP